MPDKVTTEDWKRSHQQGVRFLQKANEDAGMKPDDAYRTASRDQLSITREARDDYEK